MHLFYRVSAHINKQEVSMVHGQVKKYFPHLQTDDENIFLTYL